MHDGAEQDGQQRDEDGDDGQNAAINAAEERIAALGREHADVDARKADENSKFVDIERERQNQMILAAMNRRGRLQLRLQQTVEGLSVVVITYYGVSPAGVLAKAAKAAGLDWNPELVMGIAVPVVAVAVYAGVHRVRRALAEAVSAASTQGTTTTMNNKSDAAAAERPHHHA